jgi:hypothetical protein
MYDSVTQTERRAMTSGSPTSEPMASFVRARAIEQPAAAPPASATNRMTTDLGTLSRRTSALCASAELTMPVAPL